MSCQCRDFPQSYVVIPLAIATRNLFHNFLSLRSLLPFKINNFLIYQCITSYHQKSLIVCSSINAGVMQVMHTVLCAVWQESVNMCPPSISTVSTLCGVWQKPVSPPAQFQKKMLVGFLQEPIEAMSDSPKVCHAIRILAISHSNYLLQSN